eukprot:s2396_g6.t1
MKELTRVAKTVNMQVTLSAAEQEQSVENADQAHFYCVERSFAFLHELQVLVLGIQNCFWWQDCVYQVSGRCIGRQLFSAPIGDIEPSPFFGEDAEAVRKKHLEEVREETELSEMTQHRKPARPAVGDAVASGEILDVDQQREQFQNPVVIFDQSVEGALPSAEADGHESKRARIETAKKQRLDRISSEYAAMVRMVKFADESHHTMDEYDNGLSLDDHDNVDQWIKEEKGDFTVDGMPPELWSDCPVDCSPPEPEEWIDRIADQVELSRLCKRMFCQRAMSTMWILATL